MYFILFLSIKCIIILLSNRMNILLNNIDKVNKDQYLCLSRYNKYQSSYRST